MGIPEQASHTWYEYRTWNDGTRHELIDGEVYDMTPAPRPWHQATVLGLAGALRDFFKGKKCRPFVAPTDVKLSEYDVVQPDLFVVCDPAQIKSTHIEGAPALVVEVLSPSTLLHDRLLKMKLYAHFGVKELWLATPYPSSVELFLLANGKYVLEAAFAKTETLASPSFPGLAIPLAEVFDFPIPPEERIEEVRECAMPYGTTPGAGVAAASAES